MQLYTLYITIGLLALQVICLNQYDKKDLDMLVQNTYGNEVLDGIQRMIQNKKDKNTILDKLDQILLENTQEVNKQKDDFNVKNTDCKKSVQMKKQDHLNKKNEKESLEKKPASYSKELEKISQTIIDKQEIINKKDSILASLKSNRDFIFDQYLEFYDNYEITSKFLDQLKQKLKELLQAIKEQNTGKAEDKSDDIVKLFKKNSDVKHPFVPLMQSLESFFRESIDDEQVKKIQKIVDNLLEDIAGTQNGFQQLEEIRTKNIKEEIQRLTDERELSANSVVQLQDYKSYLQQKIGTIQEKIESLDKDIEIGDEEVMTQKAHCEGEETRFQQLEQEKLNETGIIKRITEILESDFQEASTYIQKLQLKLFASNPKYIY